MGERGKNRKLDGSRDSGEYQVTMVDFLCTREGASASDEDRGTPCEGDRADGLKVRGDISVFVDDVAVSGEFWE